MTDLPTKARACAARVRKSKFPDYHMSTYIDRLADEVERLEADNERLTAENERLLLGFNEACVERNQARCECNILRAALEPFAQPEFSEPPLLKSTEGVIFRRKDAILTVDDFRRARDTLGECYEN